MPVEAAADKVIGVLGIHELPPDAVVNSFEKVTATGVEVTLTGPKGQVTVH